MEKETKTIKKTSTRKPRKPKQIEVVEEIIDDVEVEEIFTFFENNSEPKVILYFVFKAQFSSGWKTK